ncbi:MAG: metalloregulator ArsR/SmtB family transcription factor [Acidobacteria bacterium]|nr:metalloregulator ArsR/SmtB family transcription factor [Acidobacteriota bacterium]
MVNYSEAQLNLTYAAIADPTRRAILARLRREDARVKELAAPLDISLPAVSKHIRVLERAGLVVREVKGREHYISLNSAPLLDAAQWLDSHCEFWEQRLNALNSFLVKKKGRNRSR